MKSEVDRRGWSSEAAIAVAIFAAACLVLAACSPADEAGLRPPREGDEATCSEEPCACTVKAETCEDAPPSARDATTPRKDGGAAREAGARRIDGGADARADGGSDQAGDAEPSAQGDEDSLAVVAEPSDEATYIFDPEVVHTFDVEVAPADLERVDSMPSAEQYVPARLTFEGRSYDIGYRYKGSLGAFFPPCSNPLTQRKEGKCSVKISFNFAHPDALFFGLKKLLFHSMNNDPSMLRERLGYALFREMGVPASRASHAVLRVNGKAELYALVEEVDGRFTRSRFAEGGKGNLYKEIWPLHDDPQAYINALETNEDQDPSAERMLRFKGELGEGPEKLATWMDRKLTMSYVAVDRVIMNDDGAFHFYCGAPAIGNNPKAPGNHNYYWYEAKKRDRMWIVPWDLDHAMAGQSGPAHLVWDWLAEPKPEDCNICGGLGGFTSRGPAPGCDPLIKNLQAWEEDYQAEVDRFLAGPFAKSAVDAKLTHYKGQIAAAGFPVPEAAISTLQQLLDAARVNRGFAY